MRQIELLAPPTKRVNISSSPDALPMSQEEDFVKRLSDILEQINKAHQQAQEPSVLLLDYETCGIDSSAAPKAFSLFLQDCMRLQDERFCIILVNASPTIIKLGAEIGNTAASAPGHLNTRVMVAFDRRLRMSFLSLSEQESRQFLKMLRSAPGGLSSGTSTPSAELLPRVRHLISYDPSTKSYTLIISRADICGQLKNRLRQELAEHILDEANGIYHKTGCFLIPSGVYSEGYFELRLIYNNAATKEKIARWIQYELELCQPDNVITVGKNLDGIVGEAMRDLHINHISIQEPGKQLSAIQVAFIAKSHKIAVISDVIGTQRTLDTMLESCEKFEVRKILSVIDARPGGEPDTLTSHGRTYSLESIVKKPLRFWHEDKPPQYRYEDIQRIDPLSYAPIEERFTPDQPIWIQNNEVTGDNKFLDRILRERNALVIGHFKNNQLHLPYVFLLPEIIRTYGKDISATIKNNLNELRDVGFPAPINRVFYPAQTPAADQIARMLSIELSGCETYGLSHEEIESPLYFPPGDEQPGTAVIFDNASATGRKIQRMLEAVERHGFRHILVYILCGQAGGAPSRQIQKINGYGKAKVLVRYLTKLPIPTYSQADCPQCNDFNELVHLRQEVGAISPLAEIISEQFEQLRVQEIATLLEPDNLLIFQSTPLEDRILEAKLRIRIEAARVSLAARKALANIAAQHREQPDMALRLIRVIFRERVPFQSDPVIWNEVLYVNFRRRLIDVCAFLLEPARTLPPEDVPSVAGMFILLDPDKFLDYLQTIIRRIDEPTLYRIIVEMLRSGRIRERADYLTQTLRMQPNTTAMQPIISHLEERVRETKRGSEAYEAYRQLRKEQLPDNSPLGRLLLALSQSRLMDGSIEDTVDELDRDWPRASLILRNETLPLIEKLALSGMNSSICDRLHQLWNETSGVFNKCGELATVIDDKSRSLEERITARTGFLAGLQRLQDLLLKDDSGGAVWRCLSNLYVNLIKIVQRCLEALEPELKSKNIHLKCKWTDDTVLIFGHKADVYVIVSNLLDNIIRRAFNESEGISTRTIQIEVVENPKKVTLIIRGNGRGPSADWSSIAKLHTVDIMCRRFCSDWRPPAQVSSPYTNKVKITFFRFIAE